MTASKHTPKMRNLTYSPNYTIPQGIYLSFFKLKKALKSKRTLDTLINPNSKKIKTPQLPECYVQIEQPWDLVEKLMDEKQTLLEEINNLKKENQDLKNQLQVQITP